jgi:hypothetical protein
MAIALVSFAAAAAAAACNDSTGVGNRATLRVANATSNSVDVASGTVVATGNSNIGFGASPGCVSTDVFTPDIKVSPAGTTNSCASFSPTLRPGETYVAVVYPAFAGAPEFAYIPTSLAPARGQSGLRVFNVAAGSGAYDVYITAPGAALGSAAAYGIGYRTASGHLTVPPGTNLIRLTNTGTQVVAINAGTVSFTAGQNSVLVIAPPAAGSTVPRTFLVIGC